LSQKSKVSLKLTPGKLQQLELAMDAVEEHVGKLAGIWREVSAETKQAVLDRSPILSRFLALAEQVM